MTTTPHAATADALHSGATRKALARLIPLLALVYFMAYVDRTSVALAKTELQVDVGISAAAFGLGAGLFFLTYAFFEVPSNLIMYKVGANIWIARIAISWGLVTLLSMFIQGEGTFYLLRMLLGATEAGLFPAVLYVVTQWFAQNDRGIAVGYIYLAPALANVVGAPMGGGLMSLDGALGLAGWQWMFLVQGAVTIVIGALVFVLVPAKPADAKWLSQDQASALTERAVGQDEESHSRLRGNLGKVFGRPYLLLIAVFSFFNQVAILGLVYNAPSIIEKIGVQDPFQVSLIAGLTGIGSVVGTLVVPRIVARLNRPIAILAVLSVIAAVLSVAVRASDSPVLQIALMTLISFCFSGTLPAMWVVAMEHLSGVIAAAGLALINTIGLTGGFVGPYAFGLIEDATGTPLNGLYLMAAACVISAIVLPPLALAVRRERRASVADASPQQAGR